jgi:hypothetical protein
MGFSIVSSRCRSSTISPLTFNDNRRDGLIVASHAGTIGGNLFVFQDSQDLEVFSSNGKGAINGQGYVWRIVVSSSNTSPSYRMSLMPRYSERAKRD